MASSQSQSSAALATAAVASATSLIRLQLLSRLLTFSLSQALIRLVSPKLFGTVSLQFELLLNTILFLSREAVRNSLLRTSIPTPTQSSKENGSSREQYDEYTKFSNLALLPLYLGTPIAILTGSLYLRYAAEDVRNQPYFTESIALYLLAAIVELAAEPMHLRAIQALQTSLRANAEGTGAVVKTLTSFILLVYASPPQHVSNDHDNPKHLGLLAFALGQLAYATTVLVIYWRQYGSGLSFRIRHVSSGSGSGLRSYFSDGVSDVFLAMTAQGLFKQFLTEGDKLIISRISPLQDQGGYALASNYGSLVARIVLQPVEESSRLFFSRKLTEPTSLDALAGASSVLSAILLIQAHMTGFIWCFGPPLLPLLLRFALSGEFLKTSAPRLLLGWIWYIPFLAVNGVLEAFVSSVASPADLQNQSRWMVLFSIIFALTAIILSSLASLGDMALIYANIVNLSARIVYCIHFTNRYFNSKAAISSVKDVRQEELNNLQQISNWWKHSMPPWKLTALFILCSSIMLSSNVCQQLFSCITSSLFIALTLLSACYILEKKEFKLLFALIRTRSL